jgi:energy-coupling factor transporter ATP-binding protein EcfA2
MLPALGLEVIHASAVTGTRGVVALCGESGAGKSTLAVSLAHRGYAIWADDAVAVDTAGCQAAAVPLPFTIRLRSDSARFFDREGAPGGSIASVPQRAEPEPLALLCMLELAPDAAAAVGVERLDAASACRAALAHAYCFSVKDPAHKRRTIERYLAMVARVPAYEVRFRHGFEHLAVVLDAIEDLAR